MTDVIDLHTRRKLPEVAQIPAWRRRHLPDIARQRNDLIVSAARRNPYIFTSHVLRDEKTGERVEPVPMHEEWQRLCTTHDRLIFWSFVEAGKSQQISIGRVLWEVGKNPAIRILILSKTKSLAQKIVRSCQQIVSGDTESAIDFRSVFPHVKPAHDPALPWTTMAMTVERSVPSKDPTIAATGIMGNVIGSRIDLLIIDDIIDSTNTRTPAPRQALWDWIKGTVVGRLTGDARVWAMGNAYHPDDALHRLEREGRYKTFRFPVIDQRTKLPAWAKRWSIERIERAKTEFGPLDFARALFCQPRDDDSSRFKRDWIERALTQGVGLRMLKTRADWIKELAIAAYAAALRVAGSINVSLLRIYIGVDLAVQLHSAADLTAFVVVGVLPDGTRRLLWIEAGHLGAPEILARIQELDTAWDPTAVVVENNAAQDYLVQLTRATTAIPVVPYTTGKQKAHPEFGLEGVAAELAAGKWIFPCTTVTEMEGEIFAVMQDMLGYDPRSHVGDRFMALWFAREGIRAGGTARAGRGVQVFGATTAEEPKALPPSSEASAGDPTAPEQTPGGTCLILPHQNEPQAIAATEGTLSMLPGGGRFARTPSGELMRRGPYLVLECGDPSFVVWATLKQGYAKHAKL